MKLFGSTMTVDRCLHVLVGSAILGSLYVGTKEGGNPKALYVTAFVGAALLQSGITNFCPSASILRALGVPDS